MKLISVVLVLLLNVVGAQALQTPDPNRISEVKVGGNRKYPSNTILYQVQSKPGDLLNPAVIARDVKFLMGMGFFDDVHVDSQDGPNGKILTFVVTEKKTISSFEYKGIKSITQSEILDKLRERKVGLSIQSALDPTKLKKAEGVIKMMLAEKGRWAFWEKTCLKP